MSYILDALRKSDELRQRGTAPLLQPAAPSAPPRRWGTGAVYGALAVLLVGAGMVIGGWRPWQAEQQVAGVGGSVGADARAAGGVAPVPSPVAPAAAPDVSPANVPSGAPAPVPANAILTPSAPVTAAAPERLPAAPADMPVAHESAIAKAEPAVLTQSELPPAIRQDIPAMSISVHAYSARPKDRMVGINDRLLREGGTLPPGLTLDEITPDGMVFSYKGYRFKRGLSELGIAAGAR